VSRFHQGGRKAALKRLRRFLEKGLDRYDSDRNDPSQAVSSELSPYLHFGMISAREVALAARKARPEGDKNLDGFLEELIVRRELSFNYCRFQEHYNDLRGLPDWARKTLGEHDDDPREHEYDLGALERAETHDALWNACQQEIVLTGKMHNYVRMLWGKKIIEWTPSHARALEIMTHLNNKYGLDGRDPNSYVGFLWCLGLHDRAWGERPVFGKIRYMSSASTRKKVDAASYIQRIEQLAAEREADPESW
jgi:deoxyribodipyrimidine photo-lyase